MLEAKTKIVWRKNMLIIKIMESEIKQFMSYLIKEDKFDSFETRGIEITMFTKINISCAVEKDFYENKEDLPDFCSWSLLKPYVFNIIKGNTRPKNMKIVFSFKDTKEIHDNAKALFLNILFDNNMILCTTATSQINFSLDKNVDFSWEDYIKGFFKNLGIAFSIE